MEIKEYAFHWDKLHDPLIFHTPEDGSILCTQSIPRIVKEAGLKGFHFTLLGERDGNATKTPQPCYDTTGPCWRYENRCFQFRTDIPEHWSIHSTKKGNVEPYDPHCPEGMHYQRTDDDLPSEPDDYRGLFSAYLYKPYPEWEMDASIEATVFAYSERDDLCHLDNFRQRLIDRGDKITSEGTWDCHGLVVSYIDTEMKGHWGIGTNRWVYWRVGPGLWIHSRVAGFNEDSFRHAIDVFGTLSPIA